MIYLPGSPQPALSWTPSADPTDIALLEAVGCATCGQPIVHHDRSWWHDPNRLGHVVELAWDLDSAVADANHPARPLDLAQLRRMVAGTAA